MYPFDILFAIFIPFSAECYKFSNKQSVHDTLFQQFHPHSTDALKQLVALQYRSVDLLQKAKSLNAANTSSDKEFNTLMAEVSSFETQVAVATGRLANNYQTRIGHLLQKMPGQKIDVAGIVDTLIIRLVELPKIIFCSVFVCHGQDEELRQKTTTAPISAADDVEGETEQEDDK